MWADASGVATHSRPAGTVAAAWIAAGGLMGPALLAALFFGVGCRARWSRWALIAFAVCCAAACVLVVRNLFGWIFVGGLALVLGAIAQKGGARASQMCLVFLAIQLSLSVFSRGDYLFTAVANTTGGTMPSDVAQMAAALGGPYWLWGALVGLFSVGVLMVGLWVFLRAATTENASWDSANPAQ